MIITASEARIEWANRVARHSEEMLIIAAATNDDAMRREFLSSAQRLEAQSERIRAVVA